MAEPKKILHMRMSHCVIYFAMINKRFRASSSRVTVTTTDEIAFLTASELVRRYDDGSLSPVEATKAALSRVEAHNEKINAFTLVDREGALRSANEAEVRWRRKQPLGLLDGVPLSVKDTLMVKGYPFRRGVARHRNRVR
jgi:Asp-tRNA(Asn)/Glu-tRNA(Gln) amidotransferase A subunit family amidase